MSFIDDDDLIMDLRNIPPKREPKKVNDSLPMPDDESDSLVIGEDIELTKDISNEDLESLVLGDSINTSIHDGEDTFDEDSISKANNLENSDFFDSILGSVASSISTNISDNGISLEGGLQLDENGDINAWDVDIGEFYSEQDSATQLISNEDMYDLEVEEETEEENSINYSDLQSNIFDPDEVGYTPKEIVTIPYDPVYVEIPVWMVALIIFTSAFMLLGLLTTFEFMVYSVCCDSGRNCHRPPLIFELITYLLS